jgi:hypothetical protein
VVGAAVGCGARRCRCAVCLAFPARAEDRPRRAQVLCESDDPEFVAKAADVVGLYLAPPENAVVICVDEKPSIQALERAQGYLKLPNGRTLTGHSQDYKRYGTTTLFAAFEVATGKVTAAHKKRRGASIFSTS